MTRYNILWKIKILGLITCVAFMVVILYTWILAETKGYTYFSAGEPHDIIRNVEWFLGMLGLSMLIVVTRKELDEITT
jgi:hypothetical protein